MTNVFVEPRPKGKEEGSPIDDFVVEDHADHVLATFKNTSGGGPIGSHPRAQTSCCPRAASQ